MDFGVAVGDVKKIYGSKFGEGVDLGSVLIGGEFTGGGFDVDAAEMETNMLVGSFDFE